MGGYEKEQARIQKLWDTILAEEASDDDDDSIADPEYVEVSDHDSDSEQDIDEPDEANVQDEEMDLHESEEEDGSSEQNQSTGSRYYLGKDGTKWRKECHPPNVRTRRHNIVSKLPGVRQYARGVQSPMESWLKLIDENMLNSIVANTNIYIRKLIQNEEYDYRRKETTLAEIKAVIGLLYIAGVKHGGRMNLSEFWATDGNGVAIFPATMGINRFRFLCRCIRFDDIHSREERRKLDKICAVREIFENFVRNCKSAYTVGALTTLDEMLWAFRGRCSFRMYIANKPAKYGLKIFALVDARTYYVTNLEIYAGVQPDGPYKISTKTDDVVERMCEPIYNTGRNITMDNWFTGYEIMKKMLTDYRLTIVGTLRKNKRVLPREFINSRNREVGSTIFGFQRDTTILSYIPKKNKCVLLASSMHHTDKIDEATGDQRKPEIISFYNLSKGGVDTADQLCGEYNVARNTKRWPMVVFYGLLNVAGINAAIIFSSQQPTVQNRRTFLKQLGLELVKEHLRDRASNTHLPIATRVNARKFAGLPAEDTEPTLGSTNTRRDCAFCTKRRKSRYFCEMCCKCICLQHSHYLCPNCSKNIEKHGEA